MKDGIVVLSKDQPQNENTGTERIQKKRVRMFNQAIKSLITEGSYQDTDDCQTPPKNKNSRAKVIPEI